MACEENFNSISQSLNLTKLFEYLTAAIANDPTLSQTSHSICIDGSKFIISSKYGKNAIGVGGLGLINTSNHYIAVLSCIHHMVGARYQSPD